MTVVTMPRNGNPGVKSPRDAHGEMQILLSYIRPNPTQPRSYFDPDALKMLANNIRKFGQKVPIKLRKVEKDAAGTLYEIVDGERRFRVHRMLGRPTIKAIITTETLSDDDTFTDSIISNFCREDHTPFEIARAINRFGNQGRSNDEIADIFGKSVGWVGQYKSLLKLVPDVVALMEPTVAEEHRLKFPTALLLTSLPPELQLVLAKTICDKKLNTTQARTLIHKVAHEEGVKMRGHSSSPERFFSSLVTFTTNTSDKVRSFIEAPGDLLERVLAGQAVDELDMVKGGLKQVLEDIKSLQETVQEAMNAKNQNHR